MKMDRRSFLGIASLGLQGRRRPNFVVILADDLGYGDLGSYGSKVNRTPHLDRMAREGLRFTDFHSNGPMCSPTRAALLTGRYQHRFGEAFEGALDDKAHKDVGLPVGVPTIARTLKSAGYATGIFGKWHLGYRPPFLPTSYGFDEFRGLSSGDGDHHSHVNRSGKPDWWHNDRLAAEPGYTADLVTKHGIEFIERHRERPFFLYLPHLSIHFPWQGPRDGAHRVEGRSYHDLSKLGPLESKDVGGKAREMVEALDANVGRVLQALEERGLSENTLVMFTSDNGGYLTYQGGFHNISSNGPLRGQKTDMYEGGHRVPAIARWPGRIGPGVSQETAMSFDLFPTFAELAGARSEGVDGVSLRRLLSEGRPLEKRTLFWRMRGKKAVRQGDWKLVQNGVGEKAQLFNLRDDLGETRDVGGREVEIRGRLLGELGRWERELASQ